VREFVLPDPTNNKTLDRPIQFALISADRELRDVDGDMPLAWDIVPYDGLRSRAPAEVSAITQADPGVVTAASVDSDVTGHGFSTNDIVCVNGVEGMEELNDRMFIATRIDATTLSLKTLDGLDNVDTSGYTEYDSGGKIAHSGFLLNTTAILRGATTWTFKRVLPGPSFDGSTELEVIDEFEIGQDGGWTSPSYAQMPKRYRHWQHYTSGSASTHYLFWYPATDKAYNIAFRYQKEVPDLSTWTADAYPFHPPEIHEMLWHGALAKLVAFSERAKRQTKAGERMYVRMEVMFAQQWSMMWEQDKVKARTISRKMRGQTGGIRRIVL